MLFDGEYRKNLEEWVLEDSSSEEGGFCDELSEIYNTATNWTERQALA